MERLQQLIEEGVIEEVFNQLKTGKEAEVWLVSHRGEPVAAKIYKAREFRSFKNDAGYKEGRQVRNTRTQRAMDKGSKFGRAAAEEAWKSAEADAMFALHSAGVRVPKPVLFYDGVLLMEVIGDAEGRVAPRLVDSGLSKEHAEPLYLQLRAEVVKMLAADLIHGDLSEFNILLGAQGPIIIDFPQVVTAAKNSRSEHYFRRDLGNLIRFFAQFEPSIAQKYQGDIEEIWREYVRRDLAPGFVPRGRSVQRGPPPAQRHRQQVNGPRAQGGPRPPRQGEQRQEATRGGKPQHATNQPAAQPRKPAPADKRKGPEVSYRGQAAGGAPNSGQRKSGGARRRPPRRF